jgi:hypothetical protein
MVAEVARMAKTALMKLDWIWVASWQHQIGTASGGRGSIHTAFHEMAILLAQESSANRVVFSREKYHHCHP